MNKIVVTRTDPKVVKFATAKLDAVIEWESEITINVEHVCFAKPGPIAHSTTIMCGGPMFSIEIPYLDFKNIMKAVVNADNG